MIKTIYFVFFICAFSLGLWACTGKDSDKFKNLSSDQFEEMIQDKDTGLSDRIKARFMILVTIQMSIVNGHRTREDWREFRKIQKSMGSIVPVTDTVIEEMEEERPEAALTDDEVSEVTDEKKELPKQVFWDMNELSSFTSTVPGEGDEEDTTTLHITVSAKTADEMADIYSFNASQRQQLTELLSDEYRNLWNTVLYGIGTGSGEIVTVALSQVGNVGGQPYWSWYGFPSRVEWCACFVSWCANECGYIDAGMVPKFAGCVQGSRWFKEQGLWCDKSFTPNPGDVIFFDWDAPGGFSGPQDGIPDHVGIVERVENGRVYTIEGNSGDKCCQRSYPVGYYEIYGYGLFSN